MHSYAMVHGDMEDAMTEKVNRRELFGASAATALLGAAAVTGGAATLLPVPASAQQVSDSKLRQVLDRGKLLVGTGSINPPWHFQDAAGKLVGMDVDMGRLIAKSLFADPEKVDFVQQTADSRIPNLITDKVDICFQFMTVTAERAQQVAFTHPYYREGVGLLLLANSKYNSYQDLLDAGDSIVVPVLQNVFVEDWVHKALPDAKVDQYDSIDASIQAFIAGRGDVVLMDQSAIAWRMVNDPGKFKEAGHTYGPNSYAGAVKQGDQVWLNFVNTALKEAMMGVDFDFYNEAFKKWFGKEAPTPVIGFPAEFS